MTEKKRKSPEVGPGAAAEMLNGLDEKTRDRILREVAARDPKTAEAIQKRMFVFEDLIKLESAVIQQLLRDIPQGKWALALRKASDELKLMLSKNQSARAALELKDAIEAIGPRRISDVEAVQAEIIERAKALSKA